MAGMSIRLFAGDFSANSIASIDAPSRIGMVAEYYMGNNATQTQTNTVDGQTDGLMVGSGAIYNPYSALVKSSGYLNTQLPSTAEVTVIFIAKKTLGSGSGNGSNAGLISNFVSGSPGNGIRLSSNTQFDAINALCGDLGDETFPETPHSAISTDLLGVSEGDTNFLFHFARFSTANKTIEGGALNSTQGLRSQKKGLTNPRIVQAGHLGIGLPGNTAGQEVAYAAIFDRILTDQELNTHYASLKDFYIGKIDVA